MKYSDLTSRGFGALVSFTASAEKTVLTSLPALLGVYVVVLPQCAACQRGESDIAYIGKSTNANGIRGRVRQYYHPGPTQSTNITMNARLLEQGCSLRLGFITASSKAVTQRLESDLLPEFESQHNQFPLFNRQRALDLLARAAERGVTE